MKLRNKIISGVGVVVVLGIATLAILISYSSPCETSNGDGTHILSTLKMKAVVDRCYGSPDVLKVEELPKPVPADNEMLVKVQAAAINPLDWHYMSGKPYLMRLLRGLGAPNDTRLGVDFSGTVVSVGKDVTKFKPGDEIFGGKDGALAEYITVRERGAISKKPTNMSFVQAASAGVGAITALQALRDQGHLQAGQKVLINGASGGVGTFAVQIAKSFGADVTGVCSGKNSQMVRSLGADHVIDYTLEDFTRGEQRYDLIIDNVANHSLSDMRHVLKPQGILVIIGAAKGDPWIAPLLPVIKAALMSPFVDQKLGMMMAEFKQADVEEIGNLMQSGKVTPVIDRTYKLDDVAAAMRYLEAGHAKGKVVVTME